MSLPPDSKLTNPKDHFGSQKIDLGLVPDTLAVCAARALFEGALKYGRFNWRVAGVRASIYHAALKRHVAKWWNGQNLDRRTRVHHLDNAIACLTIIRDAELYGKLNDDRPPCPNPDAMADLIDACEGDVAHLRDLLGHHTPHQYTIADTAGVMDDTRRPSEGADQAPIELLPPESVLPHASPERDGQPDTGFQRSSGWDAFRHRGKGSWTESNAQAATYDPRVKVGGI